MNIKNIKFRFLDKIIVYIFNFKSLFVKLEDEELFVFFNSLILHFESYNDIVEAIKYSINCVYHKNIFFNIIAELKKGMVLSAALQKSNVFSSDIIFLVKAGERNNTLLKSFTLIKDFLKLKINRKKKMKNSFFYPFVVFFVFLIVLFGFSNYVIPSLLELLTEINSEMIDSIYYVLCFFSILKYLCYIFGFMLLCLIYIYFTKISWFYMILFKLCFIGDLFLNYYLYFIIYSIGISLENGLSLLDSFDVVIDSLDIDFIKKKLIVFRQDLQKGILLSDVLKSNKYIPDFLIDIIRSGESTGKLTQSLVLCYKIFEEKYNEKINKIIDYLPVMLVFFISILLIIFIYLLFLPIYNLGV